MNTIQGHSHPHMHTMYSNKCKHMNTQPTLTVVLVLDDKTLLCFEVSLFISMIT